MLFNSYVFIFAFLPITLIIYFLLAMIVDKSSGIPKWQMFSETDNHRDNLQRIVEICRQKGIKLTVFISPIHVSQLEAIEVAQLWDQFADWKRKIIKITPVWDFSGYNIITTEPISNKMKNYFDHAHYRPRIGNLMLNKMLAYNLGEVPRDFGVLLTDQNLDVFLKITERQKILWEKKNYPTVQMIKGLR